MNWSFIPQYPTSGAWAHRPFKNHYTLKDMIKELKYTLPNCEGQLVFCSDKIPDTMKMKIMQAEKYFYVSYKHVNQLEEFMERIKWNETNNLHKVVVYQNGYFIQ